MPTTKHTPCATLPKFKGKYGTPKLSFFPAELWDGPEGRWRVMQGESWVVRKDEGRSYFTLEGITALVMDHLRAGLGIRKDTPSLQPDLQPGTPVTYYPEEIADPPMATRTRTHPFRDANNEWKVWIFFKDRPVLLDDLEPRGKEK